MLINFNEKEEKAIKALAELLSVSEEKVVILALRYYQLGFRTREFTEGSGCGHFDD
jgi:hypothetical protein